MGFTPTFSACIDGRFGQRSSYSEHHLTTTACPLAALASTSLRPPLPTISSTSTSTTTTASLPSVPPPCPKSNWRSRSTPPRRRSVSAPRSPRSGRSPPQTATQTAHRESPRNPDPTPTEPSMTTEGLGELEAHLRATEATIEISVVLMPQTILSEVAPVMGIGVQSYW